jgi:hypothetical protein
VKTLYYSNKMHRDSFKNSRLIYVPIGDSKRESAWLKIDECVWEGPECLPRIARLNQYYKECKDLFHGLLHVKEDVDPSLLITEVMVCQPTELKRILELFREADKRLKKSGERKIPMIDQSMVGTIGVVGGLQMRTNLIQARVAGFPFLLSTTLSFC